MRFKVQFLGQRGCVLDHLQSGSGEFPSRAASRAGTDVEEMAKRVDAGRVAVAPLHAKTVGPDQRERHRSDRGIDG